MDRKFKLWSIYLFFITCLLSQTVRAQTNFVDGQIITSEGDTLRGIIDFRNWSRNPTKIDFVIRGEEEVRSYSAYKLVEFSASGEKYISRNVTIDTTPLKVPEVKEVLPTSREDQVFLKVLVEGELSLYQYKDFRDNFYIEENGVITELISHEYIALVRGRYLLVDSEEEKYIDQLNRIQKNCRGVSRRRVDYKASSLMGFVVRCNAYEQDDAQFIQDDIETVKVRAIPLVGYSYGSSDYHLVSGRGAFNQEQNEKAITTAYIFGLKLLFILPTDLETRAVTIAFDFQSHDVGDAEGYDNYGATNFRVGYLALENSGKISPYFEGGLFVSARSSNYYREFDDESVLLGINLGVGAKLGVFQLGVNIDLANKRSAEVRHSSFAIVGGIGF